MNPCNRNVILVLLFLSLAGCASSRMKPMAEAQQVIIRLVHFQNHQPATGFKDTPHLRNGRGQSNKITQGKSTANHTGTSIGQR